MPCRGQFESKQLDLNIMIVVTIQTKQNKSGK